MSEIGPGSSIHSSVVLNLRQDYSHKGRLRKIELRDESKLKRSEEYKGGSLLRSCGEANPFANRILVDGGAWSRKLNESLCEVRGQVSIDAYRGFSDVIGVLKGIRQGRKNKNEASEGYLKFVLKGIEHGKFSKAGEGFVEKLEKEVKETLKEVRETMGQ